jgi:hypothetical protein
MLKRMLKRNSLPRLLYPRCKRNSTWGCRIFELAEQLGYEGKELVDGVTSWSLRYTTRLKVCCMLGSSSMSQIDMLAVYTAAAGSGTASRKRTHNGALSRNVLRVAYV